MNWYISAPALILLLGSSFFAIRAFKLLFGMLRDSPASHRQLSPGEGLYFIFIRPTQDREFMTNVFLGTILFVAGLALLGVSLSGGNS